MPGKFSFIQTLVFHYYTHKIRGCFCQLTAHYGLIIRFSYRKQSLNVTASTAITIITNTNIAITGLKLDSILSVPSSTIVISSSNALICLACSFLMISNADLTCLTSEVMVLWIVKHQSNKTQFIIKHLNFRPPSQSNVSQIKTDITVFPPESSLDPSSYRYRSCGSG